MEAGTSTSGTKTFTMPLSRPSAWKCCSGADGNEVTHPTAVTPKDTPVPSSSTIIPDPASVGVTQGSAAIRNESHAAVAAVAADSSSAVG